MCILMESYVDQLRLLMKAQGITQKELAQKAGTSEAAVTNAFNGKNGITFERAERWANCLGATLKIQVLQKV